MPTTGRPFAAAKNFKTVAVDGATVSVDVVLGYPAKRQFEAIHTLVGEIYVEQANKRGGWLGRPLEWIVKDDQSKPELARTLYEQLVTADKVDQLMGPYATGAILSAMGVAQKAA